MSKMAASEANRKMKNKTLFSDLLFLLKRFCFFCTDDSEK